MPDCGDAYGCCFPVPPVRLMCVLEPRWRNAPSIVRLTMEGKPEEERGFRRRRGEPTPRRSPHRLPCLHRLAFRFPSIPEGMPCIICRYAYHFASIRPPNVFTCQRRVHTPTVFCSTQRSCQCEAARLHRSPRTRSPVPRVQRTISISVGSGDAG